ncbi:MAG: hypothetical protein ACKOTE_02250, partial [Opitutaceae bacterium]
MRHAVLAVIVLALVRTTFAAAASAAWTPADARWPEPRRAPAGAPNVLIVLWDDVGFGQFGCYGSPLATPTVDRLAAGGCATRFRPAGVGRGPRRGCRRGERGPDQG